MQLTDDTIQRLVDGELDKADYQEVLLALEADPSTCESNAWRRCALTFLEAQAFEFGAKSWLEARNRADANLDTAETNAALQQPIAASRRRFPAWMTLLTVAASLAGAFWVGGLMRDITLPPQPSLGSNIATVRPGSGGSNEQFSPDGSIFVSVPVIDEGEFDQEAWLKGVPSPPPPELLRRWEREGYTASASRRLMSHVVEGRTLTIPVEQYQKIPLTAAPQ